MTALILKVRPVAGEEGRFFVTSRSLFCDKCKFTYSHKGDGEPKYAENAPCPNCEDGKMQFIEYLCDVTLYSGLGKCGCHRWQFYLQPIVAKLSHGERMLAREADEYRCHHLVAALRAYALEKVDNQVRREIKSRQREHEGE